MPEPLWGEVWLADLDPVRGHEQAGRRPVLVVSDDVFNRGPASLVIILPLTRTDRRVASWVPVQPPDGGLRAPSSIMCDGVRPCTKERLLRCWGRVSTATMADVADRLRVLLRL